MTERNIQLQKNVVEKLITECKHLNLRIDSLVKFTEKILDIQLELLRVVTERIAKKQSISDDEKIYPDVVKIWSLPDSLRKTMLTLYNLDEATAEELAEKNERKRAVESSCANQLVRLGYLKKKRRGRKVFFYISSVGEK